MAKACETTNAIKLAEDYKNDQKAADLQYFRRRFAVAGQVAHITLPDNPGNAANVYLKTRDNLPCVKLELNKMRKYKGTAKAGRNFSEKKGYELRVADNSSLEVRTHQVVMDHSRKKGSGGGVTKNGEWSPIISMGEMIKVIGTCDGLKYFVVLSNAELQARNLP